MNIKLKHKVYHQLNFLIGWACFITGLILFVEEGVSVYFWLLAIASIVNIVSAYVITNKQNLEDMIDQLNKKLDEEVVNDVQ